MIKPLDFEPFLSIQCHFQCQGQLKTQRHPTHRDVKKNPSFFKKKEVVLMR